ncbi:hypothetical protein ASG92_12920 [Arthrobacter sp. Soil736]|uniref:DUF5956 family protein n=1 Tax=Arthrobacter sp. Soil736 TaxID=1736395 RepID=UPI0006F9799F|nr:DUF5956 family protein [Arthrobacter sp. Soil736]KRE44564.1 hypothetical protein ASG92_12920 [Arthrobacter sp. Soil736]
MWESVPAGGPDEGWSDLDENGWGALIGWAAGPENLRRGPLADDSTRTVAVTRQDKDGNVTKSGEPFTAEDRQIVVEAVNSYLADAGVEQRPGGFRWFVRLPGQFSTWEELRAAVTGAVYARERQLAHPRDIAPIMKQEVQRLYGNQE